jgi:hypothetical protein
VVGIFMSVIPENLLSRIFLKIFLKNYPPMTHFSISVCGIQSITCVFVALTGANFLAGFSENNYQLHKIVAEPIRV